MASKSQPEGSIWAEPWTCTTQGTMVCQVEGPAWPKQLPGLWHTVGTQMWISINRELNETERVCWQSQSPPYRELPKGWGMNTCFLILLRPQNWAGIQWRWQWWKGRRYRERVVWAWPESGFQEVDLRFCSPRGQLLKIKTLCCFRVRKSRAGVASYFHICCSCVILVAGHIFGKWYLLRYHKNLPVCVHTVGKATEKGVPPPRAGVKEVSQSPPAP